MPSYLLKFKQQYSVKIGGRRYPVVKIGNQLWMAENLDYPWNGLDIGGYVSSAVREPHAYYYNNDEATYGYNGRKYGLLYNYYAKEVLVQNIPTGWRIPAEDDYNNLVSSIGGIDNVSKLKTADYWTTPGTNETGFSMPPSASTDTGHNSFFADTFAYLYSTFNTSANMSKLIGFENSAMAFYDRGSSPWISTTIRLVRDT